MKTWLAFWSGIFKNNPTFRLVLGLCPTLAVTTSLENAIGMGLAASFVLICSNGIISALRKLIPGAVHIPCYIVIVAAFVTTIDLLMQAYLPALSKSLGIFIPLTRTSIRTMSCWRFCRRAASSRWVCCSR